MPLRTGAILVACCLAGGLTALGESSKSGLDVAGFDRTVLPQDDLYAHVNGAWLKRTVIPDDRVTYGTFAEIIDRTDRDLHAIIEEIAARPNRPRGSAAQQIADLYESTVNVERIEQLGASAMAPQLQRIDAIQSARDVAAEAGYLSSIGAGGPFAGTDRDRSAQPERPRRPHHPGWHPPARSRLLPEGRSGAGGHPGASTSSTCAASSSDRARGAGRGRPRRDGVRDRAARRRCGRRRKAGTCRRPTRG